jgi:hypothetical protein
MSDCDPDLPGNLVFLSEPEFGADVRYLSTAEQVISLFVEARLRRALLWTAVR